MVKWLTVIVVVFTATIARSDTLRQKYVGSGGCKSELKIDPRGIRLDRSRKTYLRAYTLDGKDTLLIVQYNNDHDQCGVVRDVIQPKDTTNTLVWDCMDPKNPSAVVVGAWHLNEGRISGPSLEAWRVNLAKLQFVPIAARVSWVSVSGAGADDGSDLAGRSRKRTKGRPQ